MFDFLKNRKKFIVFDVGSQKITSIAFKIINGTVKITSMDYQKKSSEWNWRWKDIIQAKLYTLYENGEKIYVGEDTRFEKDVYPGIEYCYTIQVSGDYGLQGELSQESCGNAPTLPCALKDRFINLLTEKDAPVISGSTISSAGLAGLNEIESTGKTPPP